MSQSMMSGDPVEERDIQKLLAMLDDPRVHDKIRNVNKGSGDLGNLFARENFTGDSAPRDYP